MKITDKADILRGLYLTCRDRDEWQEYFRFADIGVPAALMLLDDYFEGVPPKIEAAINEAYGVLLKVLELPNTEYESLEQMFESALEE